MSHRQSIYTLSKSERIYAQKKIDALFKDGNSFIAYPLRIVFICSEKIDDTPAVSMLVSVSKRKFKRANKRNRIKRLVREAFRLNKLLLHDIAKHHGCSIDIAFLYLKDELSTYAEIEKAMLKTIDTLPQKMQKTEINETAS